jgi:CRP-like cAMP-binding protein
MIVNELAAMRSFISRVHALPDNEWEAFAEHWQPHVARRKAILTAAGETERYLYFVLDGVQRAFYLGENEREATLVFTYAPSFSGVVDSLLAQQPSFCYFETLTASRFLRLHADHLYQLMDDHKGIHQFVTSSLAHTLHGVLKRQAEVQVFSSEEKFRALMKRSPHLLNLVPHKYIASYLGMDATNFSKLLASISI